MSKEIKDWKPVVGYEGLYEVSNMGDVRSLDRTVKHNYGGDCVKKGRELSRYKCQTGYYEVGLSVVNKVKTLRVHRLVALAHIPNPNNYPILNHKDGDKLNAAASNLEWCTQSYNMKHAFDSGLVRKHTPARIKSFEKAAIARQKKVRILNILTMQTWEADSIKKAAEFIGVTASCVSHCIRNKRTILNDFKVSLAIDSTTL